MCGASLKRLPTPKYLVPVSRSDQANATTCQQSLPSQGCLLQVVCTPRICASYFTRPLFHFLGQGVQGATACLFFFISAPPMSKRLPYLSVLIKCTSGSRPTAGTGLLR